MRNYLHLAWLNGFDSDVDDEDDRIKTANKMRLTNKEKRQINIPNKLTRFQLCLQIYIFYMQWRQRDCTDFPMFRWSSHGIRFGISFDRTLIHSLDLTENFDKCIHTYTYINKIGSAYWMFVDLGIWFFLPTTHTVQMHWQMEMK